MGAIQLKSVALLFDFWRTYDQQEIELVEEEGGVCSTCEIKWSSGRDGLPKARAKNYPDATYEVISRGNYLSFIT